MTDWDDELWGIRYSEDRCEPGPVPIRPLDEGRWMGGTLYDPPAGQREPLTPSRWCPGEFGENGVLREHCGGGNG